VYASIKATFRRVIKDFEGQLETRAGAWYSDEWVDQNLNKLAAHLDNHDTVGQWMAHHLAELVLAAQDDATATVGQRQQIVETILKVWSHRRDFPRRAPLDEFENVVAALDRLGDDSPWRFSRLFGAEHETPDPSTSGLPLVATAAELERLTRETLLRLIWLAAQDAREKNQEWLEVADKVASNLESDVTSTLERLQHRLAHHRIRATDGSAKDATGTPAEDAGGEGEAEARTEGLTGDAATNDSVESGFEDSGADPFDDEDDDTSDPLSNINHVERLREMANLLNKIADALSVSSS